MNRALEHLASTRAALGSLQGQLFEIEAWGRDIAAALESGGRLLAAGNGGSAAEAQHLTAELVGRYLTERRPLSAIALHADSSSFTAISNDYTLEEVFARQVEAHGRQGDVFVGLSTSGRSPNVVAAAKRASKLGLHTYALTGALPNPLALVSSHSIGIDAPSTAAVQEAHLVIVHLLCQSLDEVLSS